MQGVKNAPRGLLLSGTPPVRIRAGTPKRTTHQTVRGSFSLSDGTTEGRRLTAARLLIGQSPTAAGGRGREGDCRKKHGGSQAERGEPPMFLTDGVVSSSLTGAARKNSLRFLKEFFQ